MTWLFDPASRQLINADLGYSLVVQDSGSDGSATFEIRKDGKTRCIFMADRGSRFEPKSSAILACAVDDNEMAVWRILSWPDAWRDVIKSAMLAFKTSSGWQYPGATTYVQFGTAGLPEHDGAFGG